MTSKFDKLYKLEPGQTVDCNRAYHYKVYTKNYKCFYIQVIAKDYSGQVRVQAIDASGVIVVAREEEFYLPEELTKIPRILFL